MPKNSVFICGVILMAFGVEAFAQPTSAIPPSAEVTSTTSGREPSMASSKASVAPADTVPIFPGSSVTGGQLEVLQGKTLLLEAQVQAARLKKQLADADSQPVVDSVPAMNGLPAGMPMMADAVPATPVARKPGRIAVLEVSGRGKNLQATLSFPDGRRSVVQAGSALPGSTLTVKSISLSSVTLSDGQQLTF
ncbi:type IV pilus biogenesis protein PilP [Salmonella enterica]|uniref:Pilus assembly protein n=2 Tax=Salmonella enterica TaxID=28901 RepID=A0A379QF66_SALER|nr:type IV pilus biogenesis protein PilP [Salmonella enterica]ECC1658007.1 type IV pilus biogenesis protein PilP [Salmonella enterica subsp. salamae]ASG86814.1 pilus assembly protein PilP [Salmonella enterica subsp. salamae serovar 55:k:z39 str. 1315K]ECD9415883.1 type IV pilus biogenesis protein PilP [Salmonella enterica subsp. salamae]ECF5932741.1 type IV pilus biogenesis protein PilP [Salmonella enterica subsp. salamae]ECG1251653.1 type IV pilus biogenesis protein PilP [Salmonella enterica 